MLPRAHSEVSPSQVTAPSQQPAFRLNVTYSLPQQFVKRGAVKVKVLIAQEHNTYPGKFKPGSKVLVLLKIKF